MTDTVAKALRAADTLEDLHAALDRMLDKDATPDLVPPGALVLQPNDERRRSGSHYTPRELTEPIVRHTLAPVLARLQGEDGRAPTPAQILDLKVCDPAMGSGAFLVETCRQLADALIEAWGTHGEMPTIPPDEDEVIHARRLVAQRCLYGIDRNPMAVDLAKVSLWLSTLARGPPAHLRGPRLPPRRLPGRTHAPPDRGVPLAPGHGTLPGRLRGHAGPRARGKSDGVPPTHPGGGRGGLRPGTARSLARRARRDRRGAALWRLALAAFFAEAKPKQREAKRLQFTTAVAEGEAIRYLPWLEEQRHDNPPLAPFHWEVEFPEVFDRENPGFDAFVGNPPFAGKNAVAAGNIASYPDWLKALHQESHGNADLVAHFYRRAFNLIRNGGTLGLIATNTIAQGDTRSSGLRWICEHSGEIYRATKRYQWPGDAAVVVSVLHITKGEYAGSKVLDSTNVDTITAFLFHRGGHADPVRLQANAGKSFQGSTVLGMGFTFDDTDKKGVASPLAEMHRLIEADPHNRQAIFPYIGGEEVNTSPTHAHHRYVINFRDYPLRREESPVPWADMGEQERDECLRSGRVPSAYPDPVAADWPELLHIVETRTKGTRGNYSTASWWHFERLRSDLYAAIADKKRVLATPQTSNVQAMSFLHPQMIFGHTLIVFSFDAYSAFAVLQSRFHQTWAAFLGPTIKDDLRYTPTDCFETYPFPRGWETHPTLETAGEAYYEHRAALMVRNNEGMTKTYNRFHDPYEDDAEIAEFRELHAAMDRAVLDAYGWTDIPTDCEFLLDYEIDEATWGRKKKPYRYRWPDPIRDEVLARLLALNAERAAEEARSGAASQATPSKATPAPPRSRYRQTAASRPNLMVAEPKPLWPTPDD